MKKQRYYSAPQPPPAGGGVLERYREFICTCDQFIFTFSLKTIIFLIKIALTNTF